MPTSLMPFGPEGTDPRSCLDEALAAISAEPANRDILPKKGANILACGGIQSGKFTHTIRTMMHTAVMTDCHMLVVTRCMNIDITQQIRSVIRTNRKLEVAMGQRALLLPTPHDIRNLSVTQINDALSGRAKTLLFSIASKTSLGKIWSALEARPDLLGRLAVFIDEADMLLLADSGRTSDTGAERALRAIVAGAFCVVQFTATSLPVFAGAVEIVTLQPVTWPGRRYFGITDVEHVSLPQDDRRSLRNTSGTRRVTAYDVVANVYNLHFFMNHLRNRRACHGWALGLVNVDPRRDEHNQVALLIHGQNDIHGARVVVMNNGQLRLLAKHGVIGSVERELRIDADSNLNTLLSDLRDAGENLVVIVTGSMAGRALNVVDSDYHWYVTDMLYSAGGRASGESLMQAMRLLGIFPQDRPRPRLFCNRALWNDIRAEFARHADFIGIAKRLGIFTLNARLTSPELWRLYQELGGHVPIEQLVRDPAGRRRLKALGIRRSDLPLPPSNRRSLVPGWTKNDANSPLINDFVDVTAVLPDVATAMRHHCTGTPLDPSGRAAVKQAKASHSVLSSA